ncbi:hypothetical protein HS99_0038690 [Kitasatospora aureofaciens]|uniref:Uncharacterized protein n=1 Tax=Kitasatospora aureofaciens TaxID=1894 RepID=A0A1E7MYW8_KITAU|nr:hypothetical protein B6264_00025 [Kitasatospora aureofaciens]OEV33628.1 hypothetical protein HS99_0038690 [Kitasatospora aureofaciens]
MAGISTREVTRASATAAPSTYALARQARYRSALLEAAGSARAPDRFGSRLDPLESAVLASPPAAALQAVLEEVLAVAARAQAVA